MFALVILWSRFSHSLDIVYSFSYRYCFLPAPRIYSLIYVSRRPLRVLLRPRAELTSIYGLWHHGTEIYEKRLQENGKDFCLKEELNSLFENHKRENREEEKDRDNDDNHRVVSCRLRCRTRARGSCAIFRFAEMCK